MSCGHNPPQFGCKHCIDKRGPIFDNETDHRMCQLHNVHNKMCRMHEEENTEKVFGMIDTVIDEIEEIIYYVRQEAKNDPGHIRL